jgi:thioredoxin-like negative regulator of GroEL
MAFAAWFGAAVGCQSTPGPTPGSSRAPATTPTGVAKIKAPDEPIHWIEDDPITAMARAKSEHKPILVDAWAPWCHTCLSMRSFVLGDVALRPYASRFIWLSLDTEKESNAVMVDKLKIQVWPTFVIVSPEDEQIRARWLGAASAGEFRGFLDDGEMASLGNGERLDPLQKKLAEADRTAAAGDLSNAARLYGELVDMAPATWVRRDAAIASQLMALRKGVPAGVCVETTLARLKGLTHSSSSADALSVGLGCAERLGQEDERRTKLALGAIDHLRALIEDDKAALTADDRGDAMGILRDAFELKGDHSGARDITQKRADFLERAAASAPSPRTASTYDGGRAEALVQLGRADEAVAILKKSEAALPDDYNPPARLARVLHGLGRSDDALAAIERALPKAYGPRGVSLLGLKVDILVKLGKRDEARATLESQIAKFKALPEGMKRPEAETAAIKRLETMK